MEKCEWKEEMLQYCGIRQEIASALNIPLMTSISQWVIDHNINYCPVCGADIRKPVVEPIIKRSGETWVILSNEIDYMIIDWNKYKGYKSLSGYTQDDLLKDIAEGVAVPIPEIEITDEIAKFRPMVTAGGAQTYDLLAIKQNRAIINSEWDDLDWILISDIKLATVKDLE